MEILNMQLDSDNNLHTSFAGLAYLIENNYLLHDSIIKKVKDNKTEHYIFLNDDDGIDLLPLDDDDITSSFSLSVSEDVMSSSYIIEDGSHTVKQNSLENQRKEVNDYIDSYIHEDEDVFIDAFEELFTLDTKPKKKGKDQTFLEEYLSNFTGDDALNILYEDEEIRIVTLDELDDYSDESIDEIVDAAKEAIEDDVRLEGDKFVFFLGDEDMEIELDTKEYLETCSLDECISFDDLLEEVKKVMDKK